MVFAVPKSIANSLLKKENNPMITFVTKNRFGVTGVNQIISECNLSTNVCRDVAICNVPQDF